MEHGCSSPGEIGRRRRLVQSHVDARRPSMPDFIAGTPAPLPSVLALYRNGSVVSAWVIGAISAVLSVGAIRIASGCLAIAPFRNGICVFGENAAVDPGVVDRRLTSAPIAIQCGHE